MIAAETVSWGAVGAISGVCSLLFAAVLLPLVRWAVSDIKEWLIDNIETLVAQVIQRDILPPLETLGRRMDGVEKAQAGHEVRIARLEGIEEGKKTAIAQAQVRTDK